MNFFRRYAVPLSLLVIAVTIVFVGAALVVGRAVAAPVVVVQAGLSSPETYQAPRTISVPDEAETERLRQLAFDNVPTRYKVDTSVESTVRGGIAEFFRSLRELATILPEDIELTVVQQAVIDAGGIGVIVTEEEGVVTLSGEVPDESTRTAVVDAATAVEGVLEVDAETLGVTTTTTSTTTSSEPPPDGETTSTTSTTSTIAPATTTTTTTLPRREIDDWVSEMQNRYLDLNPTAIQSFVTLYGNDLDRVEAGDSAVFSAVSQAADALAIEYLEDGIKLTDLPDVRIELLENASVFIRELTPEELDLAEPAIGALVWSQLLPNSDEDTEATAQAKQDASDEVETEEVTFLAGALIASQGDVLSQIQFDAINELGLVEKEPGTSRRAIVVLGALTVALAAFFLWRLAPGLWSEPKHFALLGILLVLAALSSRIPELVDGADGEFSALGFAIPAMLFGYVAAILYDPRTAVLLAVPVTTFVAISTADPAIIVFAAGATVAPVAFVSSVSSRRQLRVAVALSVLVLAPFAAAISWLFRGEDTYPEAALFGVLGGILAGLVAQGLVSFLENLFRITTTLTLLDLVDRNHPALRLIEEKAPGTFNHSILVGTLAGKAAREIGADPLLAQAAAFYHDLGKTEDPVYFIENQFSISNPHDQLEPIESCEIIRSHVTDGLRLARQYRLPSEISDGIKCHHGTGLMRYFYHEGIKADPDADPQLFRHHGEKPKRKELAILMISDAVEGAARAHAQEQDPTAESITKVVDAVVGEKLDDGQLDESDLTFGELTRVKSAIVAALVGYYHTRVPYPGFPGPQPERA